jgi:hypothetical protein
MESLALQLQNGLKKYFLGIKVFLIVLKEIKPKKNE